MRGGEEYRERKELLMCMAAKAPGSLVLIDDVIAEPTKKKSRTNWKYTEPE